MSRYTNPVGSQQQPCFCCSSVGDSSDTSHERHPIVTSVTQLDQSSFLAGNIPSVDTGSITNLISSIHLDNQGDINTANGNPLSTGQPSRVETLQDHFSDLKINMRALQSRQLGMSLPNGRKFNHFSNMSMVHPESRFSDTDAVNTSAPPSSPTMDLDQALDELGMLSTVTKSRHQYLLERGRQSPCLSRDRKLHRKSESSPNLASLSRLNGYRIIQLDNNYVTNVSCDKHESPSYSSVPFSQSTDDPFLSHQNRHEYRDPQLLESAAAANRRRSVPRMSRFRKDRYNRSRCPYKVPNRLCHSMQEPDYGPDYFKTCPRPFSGQPSSSILLHDSQKSQEILVSNSKYQSKSNGTSPAKVSQEQQISRSHSVEDLFSVSRRLELVLDESNSKETEVHLDQIASQFTDLHMS